MRYSIIFPNQLFESTQLIDDCDVFYLVEHELFYKQVNFHKYKLVYHRSTLLYYRDYLLSLGKEVEIIDFNDPRCDLNNLIASLSEVYCYEFSDNWIEKKVRKACEEHDTSLTVYHNANFINSIEQINEHLPRKSKKYLLHNFYKTQRINLQLLVENETDPLGGKWSFDEENRKRHKRDHIFPSLTHPANDYHEQAVAYVENHFGQNYGDVSNKPIYAVTHQQANDWLKEFIDERLSHFGVYEDAIDPGHNFMYHSVLTPMLNVGLVSPQQIVHTVVAAFNQSQLPLNSVEGFVRQIIGWREFMRGVYIQKGTMQRNSNFFGFENKIPSSFYDGSTGIYPVDSSIKKILKTAYVHHIERLMVLGNFMFLCEIHPNEVYRWFMEMSIDAYDWVMVPNVYGMSQFADGGILSTKPYFSSSNYLRKMGHFPKGEWEQIWDALYWRFIHVHYDKLSQNYRLKMTLRLYDKMDRSKLNRHLEVADEFFRNSLK